MLFRMQYRNAIKLKGEKWKIKKDFKSAGYSEYDYHAIGVD